jgi:hypothetical protein
MSGSAWTRTAVLGASLAASVMASGHAGAQPKPKKPAAPVVDVKGIGEKLRSNDPAKLAEALEAAERGGPDAAATAPGIEELLKRGTTNDLTKSAIEALGAIAQPSASPVLRWYARHRRSDVRRAAIKALLRTKGPDAVAAFKEGLHAGDPIVRGWSATGLGDLGAHDMMPQLFQALDRHVIEASGAIGQICLPEECDKFASKLGDFGLDVMSSGLAAILLRAQPLPDDTLLRVVERLRALGTSEAGKVLADVQSRWPKGGSPRVKDAIDAVVTALPRANEP